MSAVAIASKIAKKSKPSAAGKKSRPRSKCSSYVRQRDQLDAKIEALKKSDAEKMRKEQDKIEARHQAQHKKIDDEKEKQLAKLATKYGQACVVKPRKPRSDKGGPRLVHGVLRDELGFRVEAPAAPVAQAKKATTKRASKRGTAKAAKAAKPSPERQPRPVQPRSRPVRAVAASTEIVNLTPHTLTITDGPNAGSYPSKGIARVDSLPLGQVVGLPAPHKGRLYVVSLIVAERLPKRGDLRVPGEQVRDGEGRVVAARGLALPRDISPALATRRPGRLAVAPVAESVPILPVGSMRATADAKAVKEALAALKRYRAAAPKGTRHATAFRNVVTVWAHNVDGQGRLGFRVFNEEGELLITMPADVRQAGALRLDISSFKKPVSAGDKVTISAADDVGTMEAGGSGSLLVSTSLKGDESRGFLPVYDAQPSDPATARLGLEAVLYAVSTDEARVNLNGVFVAQDSGQTLLSATDGHRLVTHTDRAFSIPANNYVFGRPEAEIAASLLARSSGFIAARGRDGSLVLSGASNRLRWTLSAIERKVTYPPYRQVIPSTFTHVCDVPASDLRALLKPLVVGNKPKENHGRFTYGDDVLEVARTSIDTPASGVIPLHCAPGESLLFGGNLLYFLEAISNGPIADSLVSLYYQDETKNTQRRAKGQPLEGSLDPLRLVAAGPGWTTVAIIMPIRL